MIRGIITACIEGVIKRFTASGRPDETIADREYFQHYGFTSRPKAGAEVIIIREGGHFLAIASDDRRYRIALESGEIALYDDLGQYVHLKRTGIEAYSPTAAKVTAPLVTIVASTKVVMTTPLLEVSGNIKAHGDVEAGVDVKDRNGTKSMFGMRSVYNGHTHNETGGITNTPNQGQ